MKNLYVTKSLWKISWTFVWCIALCFLIVPIFYLIYKIMLIKKDYYVINDNSVTHYSGVFNITKNEVIITGVLGVYSSKTFFGNMFNYGNVSVDVIGKSNLNFYDVKNPDAVEKYFRSRITKGKDLKQIIAE